MSVGSVKDKYAVLIAVGLSSVITGVSSLPYFREGLELRGIGNAVMEVVALLYVPGLLVGTMLSGNVHGNSWTLQLAFFLNVILYGLLIYWLLRRRTSHAK